MIATLDDKSLITYLFFRSLDLMYSGAWFSSEISKNYVPITEDNFNNDEEFTYDFLHKYLLALYENHRDKSLLMLIADYLNCYAFFENLDRVNHYFPTAFLELIPENNIQEFINNLSPYSKKYFRLGLENDLSEKSVLFES
jgi:hypothetical protein